AMRVRGDPGPRRATKIVRQVHVGRQGFVGIRLLDLCEQLSRTQRHLRTRGRVRVGQNVERVDSVPAIRLHALVDHSWRDAEPARGRELQRGAQPPAFIAVYVLIDVEIWLHRIHVAAGPRAVADETRGRFASERRVEPDLGHAAGIRVVDHRDAALTARAAGPELRLIADIAHRTGEGTRA